MENSNNNLDENEKYRKDEQKDFLRTNIIIYTAIFIFLFLSIMLCKGIVSIKDEGGFAGLGETIILIYIILPIDFFGSVLAATYSIGSIINEKNISKIKILTLLIEVSILAFMVILLFLNFKKLFVYVGGAK